MAALKVAFLETARLRLRHMTDDDLEQMAAMLGDAEVMRYYPAPSGWRRRPACAGKRKPSRMAGSS
jgi:RimJ/RimL family protein N-acetyltransferase